MQPFVRQHTASNVMLRSFAPAIRRSLFCKYSPALPSSRTIISSSTSRNRRQLLFQHRQRTHITSSRAYATMADTNGAEESPKMQYHNLGSSGLKVSRVIVGCMTYGSPDWQGWVLNEEQSLPILKHAYDNGITTWDVGHPTSLGI